MVNKDFHNTGFSRLLKNGEEHVLPKEKSRLMETNVG